MKEILISIFSGVAGVILTIGYQYFLATPQSVTVIVDGQEVSMTQSEYAELISENVKLKNEVTNLQKVNQALEANEASNEDIDTLKQKISESQDEKEQLEKNYFKG